MPRPSTGERRRDDKAEQPDCRRCRRRRCRCRRWRSRPAFVAALIGPCPGPGVGRRPDLGRRCRALVGRRLLRRLGIVDALRLVAVEVLVAVALGRRLLVGRALGALDVRRRRERPALGALERGVHVRLERLGRDLATEERRQHVALEVAVAVACRGCTSPRWRAWACSRRTTTTTRAGRWLGRPSRCRSCRLSGRPSWRWSRCRQLPELTTLRIAAIVSAATSLGIACSVSTLCLYSVLPLEVLDRLDDVPVGSLAVRRERRVGVGHVDRRHREEAERGHQRWSALA